MYTNSQPRTAVKPPVAYVRIVLAVLVVGSASAVWLFTTVDGPHTAQPRQDIMAESFTSEEVRAVRARSGFDEKAMQLGGVIGVGTGGTDATDSWISVLCVTETACDDARQALGGDVEGVPIRYRVTGVIEAQ